MQARSGVVKRSWLLRHSALLMLLEAVALAVGLSLLARSRIGILVAGLAAVACLLLLAPVFGGRSLVGWMRLRSAHRRRRPRRVRDLSADLVPLAEWVPGLQLEQTHSGRGDETGVISDGQGWAAVLSVETDDDLLADSGAEIDLASLEAVTVADDIVFDGVQVVTYTVPAPTTLLLGPGSQAATAYAETAEELPPTMRRTWLCLRLDPVRCLPAVQRRGEGTDGINAALRFGLHRAQSLLKRQGVETRVLPANELAEVLALTCGVAPDPGDGVRTTEDWEHWSCDGMVHTGHVVKRWGSNPSATYQRLLEGVARIPALFSVTSWTLTASGDVSGGVRLAAPSAQAVSEARERLAAELGKDLLQVAGGTQVPMMLATVPLGRGVEL